MKNRFMNQCKGCHSFRGADVDSDAVQNLKDYSEVKLNHGESAELTKKEYCRIIEKWSIIK